MNWDAGLKRILDYLKQHRGATNNTLLELLENDQALFNKIREYLIFSDLAADKKGVGLLYLAPKEISKVFLSYGRRDAEPLAKKLAADLNGLGHKVWLDREQIRSGKSWEEQIEKAILDSEVFLSLLTPHAVRRPDGVCLDEISLARYNRRKIIPIMVMKCTPPLGIYRLDWLDLQDWDNPAKYERTFEQICQLITEDGYQVEGIHSHIFSILKPLDFKLDIYRHVKDFTGREWILDSIRGWIELAAEKVLFITGDPGSGKTALMAKLIHILPEVGAYHFCIAKYEASLLPANFVQSIASQLATQIPDYRELLSLMQLQTIVNQEAGSVFRQLILEPLAEIKRQEPVIMIIDALDEALYYGSNNIAMLLYEWMDEFPDWVKIIATSRKVTEILGLLEFYKPYEINIHSPDNQRDIKQYVNEMLSARADSPFQLTLNEALVDQIVEKSEGIFLFARKITQNLISKSITPAEISSLSPGLSSIYLSSFRRIFNGGKSFSKAKPILELILAAFEPLTLDDLALYHTRESREIRQQLNVIAEFFPEKEGVISPFHKSLSDWLLYNSGPGHEYLCDLVSGHRMIAKKLLQDWKDNRIYEYLIEYLPKHLFHAGMKREMTEILCCLDYIEIRCEAKQVYRLIEDYRKLIYSADLGDSLTTEYRISRILEFLFKQSDFIQLYGHLTGFIEQQAFNEGLIPVVFKRHVEDINLSESFLFSGFSIMEYEPYPPVPKTFFENRRGISDLSISADGENLISSSFDRTVRLWNLVTGECLQMLKFESVVESLSMAADGSFIAMAGQFSGNDILFYDQDLKQLLFRLKGHTDKVNMIKLSENYERLISCSNDRSFMVWDTEGRELLFHKKYSDRLLSCCISADGSTVGVSTNKGLVEVWNIDYNVCLFSRQFFKGEIRTILLTPGSLEIIIGGGFDKTTEVWDIKGDEMKYKMEGHGNTTYGLCFDKGKRLLATCGKDRFLKVWDFDTGTLIKKFESHTRVTRRIVANYNMEKVVTGGGWRSDNAIRLWDIHRSVGLQDERSFSLPVLALYPLEERGLLLCVTRKQVYSINLMNGDRIVLKDKLSVQVSVKAGDSLFIALKDGTILCYELEKNKWDNYFKHSERITSILPLQHRAMMMGDWKGKILLYRNSEVISYESGMELKIKQILKSPEYQIVLGFDDQIMMINRTTGDIDHNFKYDHRISSNMLAIKEKIYFGDVKGNIVSFHPGRMQMLNITAAHSEEITRIVLHESSNQVISTSVKGNIRIWSQEMSGPLFDIQGHDEGITDVLTMEGPFFITVSGRGFAFHRMESDQGVENTLKKWNILNARCVAVYPAEEIITSICKDSQGHVFIGQRNGQVHQFDITN